MKNWQTDNLYISKLKKNELRDLITFVVTEIYEHFNYRDYTQESFENELEYLFKEDIAFYDNSIYYVLRDSIEHKIYGSIKTTLWDHATMLPMEKLFHINIQDIFVPEYPNIWHLGRFVISRKIPDDRISILKKMLYKAFYPVYAIGAGIIVAECDKKLTITLKKMGIDSFILGESIDYICSETLPIYIKSNWLQQYIFLNTARYFQKESREDCKFFLERKKDMVTEKIML